MINFKDTPKFVINLPQRPDRLSSVMREFRKKDLDVSVWKATDKDELSIPILSRKADEQNATGIYACLMSHLSLIKHCKAKGYEYVVIFEDDVILCNDFDKRVKMIEEVDFDMLYIGGHFDHDRAIEETPVEHIYKCNSMAGTYGYILRNTGFDYIINNISFQYGMDEFYDKVFIKKFNVLAFIPFLVDHIGGMSDVAGRKIDYPLTHKNYKSRL